ncbi:MAG TPA: carboxypeptidase M32 [Nitrospira sp.]|nr:carboxypeptidase M32 [Nitrospira sp.]HNI66900.1 carboxypeptidase M32 [Nitrospira sp.]HNK13551.1 carboxypeptidase M32 [Nitrospira sp.]HNL87751.1 carboxypeptidase M32 [Nitrospira sp.]HNO33067.1 carboxypeptidase M32 [Nitrospira sp.]
MKTLATLEPLTNRLLEIRRIQSAASVLSWDQETYMPAGGGAARAEQIATLEGLAHEKLVSQEVETLLADWIDPATGQAAAGWDEPSRSLLRETWRDFSRAKKLPSAFVIRLSRECSLAQQAWVTAREESRFSKFLPSLRTIISLKREEADYLGYRNSPYDALLDTYEPGATIGQLAPLFTELRERLVVLLRKVQASGVAVDDTCLHQRFDQAKQIEFGRLVLVAMGYDFERGRLDLSAHPFTTSFHPTDVRVTTRVFEKDLPSCLFSCIHEGGHGLYDQGLDPRYYGSPLGESVSLGIHESQSRLWENCVGRSRAFWHCFYPILQQTFPQQLGTVPLDLFYAAINRASPSLIRVEADELTYNLHIMLRVEIEQALIENRVQPDDLPELWNEKMQSYLGIVPEQDAEGVLQDVHWSMGAFGYFPTYTLGNLYAVQFFEQAKQELPQLEEHIAAGQLVPLRRWLEQKIHRWGRMFTPDHLARRVTGKGVSPEPFLHYLEGKYRELYQL